MGIRKELRYFTVTPQIVPADSEQTITIRSMDDRGGFHDGEEYKIRCMPVDRMDAPAETTAKVVGRTLTCTFRFPNEQEHYLYLDTTDNTRHFRFSVYSLQPDLFGKMPLKGDLHMHSNYSDGQDHPAIVAASCRRAGYDFIALTDHHQYAPSQMLIEYYRDTAADLLLVPGEEVHPDGNPVHMIHFGGDASVNEYTHTEEYQQAVAKILEEETFCQEDGTPLAEGDAWVVASCRACYAKMRELNGLSIYCHPYWYIGEGNYLRTAINEYMFHHKCYDAEELLGGYYKYQAFSNQFEIARFFEGYWQGNKCGIVGVSDSHGTENDTLFGWYYTICFADSNARDDIVAAIRNRYSVAVEALGGETPHIYGELRLVKYANFLMENIYQAHDEQCQLEGDLMARYFVARESGDTEGAQKMEAALAAVSGSVEAYYKRMFA